MVNVSKRKLGKEDLKRIRKQFSVAILNLRNTKAGTNYLTELLTESEQLLLSKRLAIILMLDKKISWTHIQIALDVSRSTIANINRKLLKNEFQSIVTILCVKKNREIFWPNLEVLLRAGMPPRGKHRWDSVNARNRKG